MGTAIDSGFIDFGVGEFVEAQSHLLQIMIGDRN